MIKDNASVKMKLTDEEMIGFTKDYADGFFGLDENGNAIYTPYLKDLHFKLLFYLYCVNGITFEMQTAEDGKVDLENILAAADRDPEVADLFTRYLKGNYKGTPLSYQLGQIKKNALDMVEFRKQIVIHSREDALSELLRVLTGKLEDLDMSGFTPEKLSALLQRGSFDKNAVQSLQEEVERDETINRED